MQWRSTVVFAPLASGYVLRALRTAQRGPKPERNQSTKWGMMLWGRSQSLHREDKVMASSIVCVMLSMLLTNLCGWPHSGCVNNRWRSHTCRYALVCGAVRLVCHFRSQCFCGNDVQTLVRNFYEWHMKRRAEASSVGKELGLEHSNVLVFSIQFVCASYTNSWYCLYWHAVTRFVD